MSPAKQWKSISVPRQKRGIVAVLPHPTSSQFRQDFSAFRTQILIKFISRGSYFPEVRAFGTLITSTKVIRLVISKII